MTASKKLYLEDIAVGDDFTSAGHALDAEQIVAFARQFDPQPFHLGEESARGTFFEGLAASGWHTSAISMKLIVQSVPFADGIIGAGGQLAWPHPTRPGDVLRVVSKVAAIKASRSKPDRGLVEFRCLTLNQRDEVLQDLTAKMLVFKRDR